MAILALVRWWSPPSDLAGPATVVGAAVDPGTGITSSPDLAIIAALLGVLGILSAYTKWSLSRVNAEKDAAVAAKDAAHLAQLAAKDAEISRAWQEKDLERERANVLRDQLDAVTRLQIEQGIAAARDNARALDGVMQTLQGIERDRAIARAAHEQLENRRGRLHPPED